MPRKKSTEQKKEWEKRFILVFKDENIFNQFQTLCHIAETDPSKFLIDYVNRVVMDNQQAIKAHTENKNKIKV